MKHLERSTLVIKAILVVVLTTMAMSGLKSQVNYYQTTLSGSYPSAIGISTKALGNYSFAAGGFSQATSSYSIALGFYSFATYSKAIAIGSAVKSNVYKSIVIGSGSYDHGKYLENNVMESLMVGFNSKYPTLFVVQPEEQDLNYTKTGKIGIGNVTSPLAKLHLRADEGEDAAIYVQPHNWLEGDGAGIYFGNFFHGMSADTNLGIRFLSQKNYVFGLGNVGLGVEEPKAKLHVDGEILFENPNDGFIMKSENGLCWKVTINNDGSFNSTIVNCENFSSTQNNMEDKHTPLYFYPNPTSGLLKIDNRSNTNGWVVEFRSLNGTLLKSDNLVSGTNQFDLNFAADGMLLVSVYDQQGNRVTSEKIVVK